MAIAGTSVWLAGLVNGYDSNCMSLFQKFTISSIAFGLYTVKILGGNQIPVHSPKGVMGTIVFGVPLLIGSTFCLGTILGQSVRNLQKKC